MPGVESFLDRYIPGAGDVALDVGANHGVWSLYLVERFATVYAIEANPALHADLMYLHPHLQLLPVGAWSHAERRTFVQFAADGNTSGVGGWTGIMAGPPLGSFEAHCYPIDEMPIKGKVDFVKVDTEGAEVEVLRGAEQTIRRDRPHLIIEVHTGANGVAAQDLLGAWGYKTTLLRHPYYQEGGEWWGEHFWLIGEPV